MADIPGIIEGASSGKGLGLQFLRHIERTRLLIFLIDSTTLAGAKTKKEILKSYETLLKELKTYEAKLMDKPKIICFTKSDAIDEKLKSKLEKLKLDEDKVIISSVTGENLDKLKDMIWKKLKRLTVDS